MVADGFDSKYPEDTSVQIHASGNSFRTRLTRLNCGGAADCDVGKNIARGGCIGCMG